jgi:isochorismate synthase
MDKTTILKAEVFLPQVTNHRHITSTSFNGSCWVVPAPDVNSKNWNSMSITDYQSMIERAKGTMNKNPMEKVVLSRIITLVDHSNKATFALLRTLCHQYPAACVFYFSLPNGDEWMGATPEKLLTKRGEAWSTIALAGTRTAANQTPWTIKEIHEQRLVNDFIYNVLNSNGAKNIVVSERYDRQAGNLVHLANDIRFESNKSVAFWAQKIHPTPAVCGFPRNEAQAFIDQYEPHNRGFYTGLIGLEHENEDADVYVILRCARKIGSTYQLFVGGGITMGSQWLDEFTETERKAETFKIAFEK